MHLTLGYPDLLMHMPRIPLALAGLRRRFGAKERRMPVTPDMLKWLGDHLQYGRAEEASLLSGALTLGFFFLLRASEYLDVGYQDPRRGLRGSDVTLKLNGNAVAVNRISEVDEVTLLVRGSKTDIYNRGQVRNHFRTAEKVCVVKSVRAVKGLGLRKGTSALTRCGASALWAQYQDTSLVKRWGRWASDSFQTYIWEARETAHLF